MKNTVLANKRKLNQVIKELKKDGVENLFILSDFDGTLTKALYGGKPRPSLISILRNENYLSNEYSEKAKALYNKYHPIVDNPKLPLNKRKKKAEEWWRVHYRLLIESGLRKHHLQKVINSGKVKLRGGGKLFFKLLQKYNVPLIIISSSGLGVDVIKMALKKERLLSENVFIIGNQLIWDKKGKLIKIKEPIIHSLNKEGKIIQKFPLVFNKIKNRNNVIVLGNDISDLSVIKGVKAEIILRIGFLNENIKQNIKEYRKYFDFLILFDGSLNPVNKLLKKILSPK